MRVNFASRELERICTDSRYMRKKLGAEVAKKLRLRVAELKSVTHVRDLLEGTGRWEELKGDRRGTWSARLSANWRLIIRPGEQGRQATVTVIDIEDYH